jgi:hypothetical protein
MHLITSALANTAAGHIEHSLASQPMPAYARSKIVPCDEVGVYHCISRCVRRAFLCGVDPTTGQDYDYRKEWIRERLEHLASTFAIDICIVSERNDTAFACAGPAFTRFVRCAVSQLRRPPRTVGSHSKQSQFITVTLSKFAWPGQTGGNGMLAPSDEE